MNYLTSDLPVRFLCCKMKKSTCSDYFVMHVRGVRYDCLVSPYLDISLVGVNSV